MVFCFAKKCKKSVRLKYILTKIIILGKSFILKIGDFEIIFILLHLDYGIIVPT